MPRSGRIALRSEDGAALVTAVVFLPVLVLFMAFVIDIGNWFEHKRHLQMQADSAALAAAGDVRVPCDDAPILDTADKYHGTQFNAQVSGRQGSVQMAINSPTYPGQSSPVDSTVVTGSPCTARMIDVKLTETDVPWFFRLANVPFINAHARVEIKRLNSIVGLLPLAVPEAAPKKARVTFINEDTGATLGSADLTKTGVSPAGLALWDNAGSPASVTVANGVKRIGARVTLSGGSSTTCGDPLVECYDATSSNGALFVRGYDTTPTSGAQPTPKLQDVRVYTQPGGCDHPSYTYMSSTCNVGIRATVDFGSSTPVSRFGAGVTATVDGKTYTLNYVSSSGNVSTWDSGVVASVPPQAGARNVGLSWSETRGSVGGTACTNSKPCKGTFGSAEQRIFSGTDAATGPIRIASIDEGATQDVNSLAQCNAGDPASSCTYDLTLRIGLEGSLADAQSVSDPPVSMRVVGGSQNQTLDCDPNVSNFKDELWKGCGPSYEENTGTPCPDSVATLWSSPQPWNCVATQTGTSINQVAAGLNLRVLGAEKPTACTAPNNWSQFPNLPAGDPRIVQLVITPFGTFQGSGNTTVPVQSFSSFYLTGWEGQGGGFNNPCKNQGDDPVPGSGYIVGHFIKYIHVLNQGGSGSTPCDFAAFGDCVATLTE